MIVSWLKQPVARAHVLLDRKGKTLSHVFVEMANEDAAKVALRTTQNSVLGQGKRARGVTVTRSSQEELMKSVSPLPLSDRSTDSRCFSCSHLGKANSTVPIPPWPVSLTRPSSQPCKLA
jgi:site-specific recombinase XerC